MFTLADLHKEMENAESNYLCKIQIGEYELSIAYGGMLSYSMPHENKIIPVCEYTEVELALFKNEEWVYKEADLNAVLGKYASLWEPAPESCGSSVAGWVPVQTVCDIVNHLRETVGSKEPSKHTSGRCRRCGGYDDYIQDGELCYRCC